MLPPSLFFSVVYSPSLDQLGATEAMLEPPPAYSTVFSVSPPPVDPALGPGTPDVTCAIITPGMSHDQGDPSITMVLPPKYDAVTKPLPSYTEGEPSEINELKDKLPPYKEDPDSDDTT